MPRNHNELGRVTVCLGADDRDVPVFVNHVQGSKRGGGCGSSGRGRHIRTFGDRLHARGITGARRHGIEDRARRTGQIRLVVLNTGFRRGIHSGIRWDSGFTGRRALLWRAPRIGSQDRESDSQDRADGRGGDQESATPDGALRCRPMPE